MNQHNDDRNKNNDKNQLDHLLREFTALFADRVKVPLRAEFKEELKAKIEKASVAAKPGMKRFNANTRRLKVAVSMAVLVVMFGGVFWGFDRLGKLVQAPVQVAGLEIRALNMDKQGIDRSCAFLLTSSTPLNEKTVRETLQIEPAFSYTLEKGDGGKKYRIVPEEALASNTVYTMSFDLSGRDREDVSWAFQTKGSFRVDATLPHDRATHVPVDIGIEFITSYEYSQSVDIANYFAISPQVEGRFEKHKNTLVFVPKQLSPGTVYTVTLKKGLPAEGSSETLGEDYTFSFETEGESVQQFDFTLDWEPTEFASGEAPIFPAYFYSRTAVPPVTVTVYKYQEHQAYIAAQKRRDKIPAWTYMAMHTYREDLSGLSVAGEYAMDFLSPDSYMHYVVLPESLPDGYYAVEMKVGETVRQAWFQVTDLATYLAVGEGKSLLWINDLKTKAPVKNAQVTVYGTSLSGESDEKGLVLFEGTLYDEEKEDTGYAVVRFGEKEAVIPLKKSGSPASPDSIRQRDYWRYLYLDRGLYKPGDTVNFWGILSPRDKGVKAIGEVTVELEGIDNSLFRRENSSAAIGTKNVPVSDKTFSGSLELPLLKPGYYCINLRSGDTILTTRWFRVETYQKPAYKIEVKPEKRAIFAGERVNFLGSATFFEGSPMPQLSLTYYISGREGTVKTDEQGIAKIPFTAQANSEYYAPYDFSYLGLRTTLPEYGEISSDSGVYVFNSQVYLEGKATRRDDGSFSLEAKLSGIDLSKVNAGDYMWPENYLSGPVAGGRISGRIYRDIWEKIEQGERYDFISKKVEKIYLYEHSTQLVSEFSMTTDAAGEARYEGMLDLENTYHFVITAQDSAGREAQRKVYIPGSSRGSYYDYQFYHLQAQKEEGLYEIGEEAVLSFCRNEEKLAARDNGYLYIRGQEQIESYQVASEPEYSFLFAEENVPNINVYGVYFDGRAYRTAYPYYVRFNSKARAINVEIKTDKEEYRPKETVRLEMRVTDKNGRPLKAQVNLNLVDEALYYLQDQYVDLLSSLYTNDYHLELSERVSHNHPDRFGGGAEKGGEGGGSERENFRDTVLFANLETDGSGQSHVEFELPDNLTTWRVTYHAVTKDIYAQSGTVPIPVRLPFFVDWVINDIYLEGDTPVITIRAFGEKLKPQEPVHYRIKLVAPDGKEVSFAGNGISFTAFDWQLPPLQAGNYRLTVEGSASSYKDAVSKEISVVKTLLEKSMSRFYLLGSDLRIDSLGNIKEPVKLVFSDYEKGRYLEGLYRLAYGYGGRIEQKLAAREAIMLLKEYYGEENSQILIPEVHEDAQSLLAYQQDDGGIAILPYASSDLALSAVVASSGCGDFDRQAMKNYFNRALSDESKEVDRTLALWGLAALRQPVLLEITDLIEEDNSLTPAQKIQLALAALDIGNGNYAMKVYRELLDQYGEDLSGMMRIKAGQDQDEIITATTQMALLAARLDQPEKHKLYQYLLENTGTDILNNVEQLLILKYFLKYMDAEPVSFSYELDGKKETVTLKDRETYTLTIVPEDIPKLTFSNVRGQIGLMAAYTAPYRAGESDAYEGLSVKRTYQTNKATAVFNRTDLVKVVITYEIDDKAPGGNYEIVDVLPAGLRYVKRPFRYYEKPARYWEFPAEVNGQKVIFNVSKGNGTISYYARVVTPGEYQVLPTLLSHLKSNDVCVVGEETKVRIE